MAAVQVACEWGRDGIESLRHAVDVLVIVDVLSFTTCVDIAVARGAEVYPYAWKDTRSRLLVEQIGGVLAGSTRTPGFSLSPASLTEIPAGTRLVLPSPNGSTLSMLSDGTPTLAGCLRNARATAAAARKLGGRIGVIPAGERWPDGSPRDALEDWLGAGAIIDWIDGEESVHADLARRAFRAARASLYEQVREDISGQELLERGRENDLRLASQLDCSSLASLLTQGAYRAFRPWND